MRVKINLALRKWTFSPVRLVLENSWKRSLMLFVGVSLQLGSIMESNLIQSQCIEPCRMAKEASRQSFTLEKPWPRRCNIDSSKHWADKREPYFTFHFRQSFPELTLNRNAIPNCGRHRQPTTEQHARTASWMRTDQAKGSNKGTSESSKRMITLHTRVLPERALIYTQ